MFIRTAEEVRAELEEVEARRKDLRNELKRVAEYAHYFYFMDKAGVIAAELRTSVWSSATPYLHQPFITFRSYNDYRNMRECDKAYDLPTWTSPAGEVRVSARIARDKDTKEWYGNYTIAVGGRSKNHNSKMIKLDAPSNDPEKAQELMLAEIEKAMVKIKSRYQKKFSSD